MVKNLKFLVMDVDGTITDSHIYTSDQGELFKSFNIKDGCGIKEILPEIGIIPVVITARKSRLLEIRCFELGITEIHQNCREKLSKLKQILNYYSSIDHVEYSLKNVAYIGDDFLDLKCMIPIKQSGGVVVCPSDAIKEILLISDFISSYKAADGALREFIEWMYKFDSNLNEIKKYSVEAYKFLEKFSLSCTAEGSYELDNSVRANVISYFSKPSDLTCYESHKKFVDIQFIIYGKELILTEDVSVLKKFVIQEYSEKLDVIRYNYNNGKANILTSGDIAVYYPKDCHRGEITPNGDCRKIRKIVFKIPSDQI